MTATTEEWVFGIFLFLLLCVYCVWLERKEAGVRARLQVSQERTLEGGRAETMPLPEPLWWRVEPLPNPTANFRIAQNRYPVQAHRESREKPRT
ncbi:MAG: hypothetical protein V4671_32640 [Armatimonadota bacterium]